MYPVEIFVVHYPDSLLSGLQLVLERDVETLKRGILANLSTEKDTFLSKVSWKCFGKDIKEVQQAITEKKGSTQVILYADCLPDYWFSYLLKGVNAVVAIKDHQELPIAIHLASLGGIYLSKEYKNCFRNGLYYDTGFELAKNHLGLTEMEIKVIREIAQDRSNKEIAEVLYISERTVEYHISSAMRKMGVKSRVGLVVNIIKMNLIDLKETVDLKS